MVGAAEAGARSAEGAPVARRLTPVVRPGACATQPGRVARCAALLRRLPCRSYGYPRQQDHRLLQSESGHAVRPRRSDDRRSERRLRRLPNPHEGHRAGCDDRGGRHRRLRGEAQQADAKGATRRRSHLYRQPARPRRGLGEPDPYRAPAVSRQGAAGSVPRTRRSAEDARLRQGRHPRRRHRAHRAGGVRRKQRLLPEDHLPHRLHQGHQDGSRRRRQRGPTG